MKIEIIIRAIYLIFILLFGFGMYYFQENIEIPNAEKAWDECNDIEEKESYAYYKCLERYDINRKEVRSKHYMTTMIIIENVFVFLMMLTITILLMEMIILS